MFSTSGCHSIELYYPGICLGDWGNSHSRLERCTLWSTLIFQSLHSTLRAVMSASCSLIITVQWKCELVSFLLERNNKWTMLANQWSGGIQGQYCNNGIQGHCCKQQRPQYPLSQQCYNWLHSNCCNYVPTMTPTLAVCQVPKKIRDRQTDVYGRAHNVFFAHPRL
jgi:hypothetical protein